ncbi:Lipase 2 [bioreactor metagenome]|uniref:Lipase 2 n=1 Tax=bioreactor metagenome TaxID=1076179 RepID=A0A645AMQ3_9ZZZZ
MKKSEHPRSAVLFLHGSDRNTARFCAGLALKADVTVAAPDLRVAPEAPWPAALEDALSAYNHLCTNADDLGVNPERIVPGGDGAGALLALALVRNEYETTGEKPAGLLLFYPFLAPEGENRGESWKRYGTEFGLDAEAVTAFVDDWIADAEDRKNVSPFRAGTEGVPPTLLVVAGCDVLRDQGLAFAAKLRQANVPVRIRRYNGAIHGFLTRPGLDVFFRQGVEDAASFLGGLPGGK